MKRAFTSPKTRNEGRSSVSAALAAAFLSACGIALAPAALAADTPRAVVQRTTSAVVEALSDGSVPAEEKGPRIQAIAGKAMDFETLSSLVLARYWRPLTGPQREEFVREFKKHLSFTYGRNLQSYKDVRVEVVRDRQEIRGDWTVQTRVVRSGQRDLAMDYRLRMTNGEWHIIDIVIEGVSLVSNFRSQFQEIISNRGFPGLLEALHKKNAAEEPVAS